MLFIFKKHWLAVKVEWRGNLQFYQVGTSLKDMFWYVFQFISIQSSKETKHIQSQIITDFFVKQEQSNLIALTKALHYPFCFTISYKCTFHTQIFMKQNGSLEFVSIYSVFNTLVGIVSKIIRLTPKKENTTYPKQYFILLINYYETTELNTLHNIYNMWAEHVHGQNHIVGSIICKLYIYVQVYTIDLHSFQIIAVNKEIVQFWQLILFHITAMKKKIMIKKHKHTWLNQMFINSYIMFCCLSIYVECPKCDIMTFVIMNSADSSTNKFDELVKYFQCECCLSNNKRFKDSYFLEKNNGLLFHCTILIYNVRPTHSSWPNLRLYTL